MVATFSGPYFQNKRSLILGSHAIYMKNVNKSKLWNPLLLPPLSEQECRFLPEPCRKKRNNEFHCTTKLAGGSGYLASISPAEGKKVVQPFFPCIPLHRQRVTFEREKRTNARPIVIVGKHVWGKSSRRSLSQNEYLQSFFYPLPRYTPLLP